MGPILAIVLNVVLILVQGWSCFSPHFKAVDFVSYYIELPIMLVMFLVWKLVKRTKLVKLEVMDLVTDRWNLEVVGGRAVEEDDDGVGSSNGDGDGGFRSEKGVVGKVKRVGMWLFL